jgi:hypothetical protein
VKPGAASPFLAAPPPLLIQHSFTQIALRLLFRARFGRLAAIPRMFYFAKAMHQLTDDQAPVFFPFFFMKTTEQAQAFP